MTNILLPDGGTITYTYDADDRVAEEQHRDATGIDCQIAYSYDAAGNRTGRKITDGKETVYAEETHAYDLMNREIRYVDGEGGMTTRSYDQDGREPFRLRRGDDGCGHRTVLSACKIL